jgi:hypothetical protein
MAAPQALSTVGCFDAVHRIPGPVQPDPVAVHEAPVSAQRTPVDARKIPVVLRDSGVYTGIRSPVDN